jgi:alpha-L-fucosidase
VLYFDTNELPLGQAGLDVVSHYYNSSAVRNGGAADVVVNGKHIEPAHVGAFVEDIERGVANGIRPEPWQTDTCIGDWHYSRALAESNGYKTVAQVVGMLVDVVSKNGNLMLNVPVRGDGTIDEHERAFLEGLAAWMEINGEGIFATRPWKLFGEGPTRLSGREENAAYTSEDIRFTAKAGTLYAFVLAWPGPGSALIKSLAASSPQLAGRKVTEVSLLGYGGRLEWSQGEQGLAVKLPEKAPSDYAATLRIKGAT